MNQSFSPDQVIKLCKASELMEYSITKEKLKAELQEAFEKITAGTFEFSLKQIGNFLLCDSLIDKLILRKLNDNIKRLYKEKQSDRRMIVYQIKTLLEDESPMWIFRTDISAFYPSINRNKIIDKLKGDSILTYFSIKILEKLFDHHLFKSISGLPLGISVSSTLSEIYMRQFDRWARAQEGVYYYARFVDDIIVFSFKESYAKDFEIKLNEHLPDGLVKNESKNRLLDGKRLFKNRPLEFLGYKFFSGDKDDRPLMVSIADEKVRKIKSRMILSFVNYLKNKDADLLEDRIKFLTGNYTIKSTIDGNDLRAGVYYNYIYVTDLSIFEDLNVFLYKTLNCKKYTLGRRLAPLLPIPIKEKLARYSFKHGFKNKVHHKFDPKRVRQISNCWK